MWEIWANQLLPKSNKPPNLVTLVPMHKKIFNRQVREHVFSDASQKTAFDHSDWAQHGEHHQGQQRERHQGQQQQRQQWHKPRQQHHRPVPDYQIRQGIQDGIYNAGNGIKG